MKLVTPETDREESLHWPQTHGFTINGGFRTNFISPGITDAEARGVPGESRPREASVLLSCVLSAGARSPWIREGCCRDRGNGRRAAQGLGRFQEDFALWAVFFFDGFPYS